MSYFFITILNVIKLVSISPTFYDQLLHQNPFATKLQTYIVSSYKQWKNIHTKKLVSSGLYYKHVRIIIYDRNDSVQYHKTTITIVIDDP